MEGSAEVALHLAISEVYHYDDPADRTWIGWNNEPECRKGLGSDKNRIGIFNGKGLEPRFYEQGSDQWPDIDQLQKENTHRIVLAEAAWTPRAYNAIALFGLPCLITFVPGLTKEGRDGDWRVQLSTQVNERLRTQDANPHQFFTLAQPYVSAGAADRLAGLYDLSFLLDVKGETEPKVFMMVPEMNELVEFDAVLDSESAFSPDRILKWADFSMDSLAVGAAHAQLSQLQSQEVPSPEASGKSEGEYKELIEERKNAMANWEQEIERLQTSTEEKFVQYLDILKELGVEVDLDPSVEEPVADIRWNMKAAAARRARAASTAQDSSKQESSGQEAPV